VTESTSTANASDPILHGRGGVLRDCLFLLLIATLSVAPYVTRLGFYGDDWAILAALVNADDSSFRAMWDAQYEQNVNLQRRPTQILYQAVLFRASALNPLGYHAVNAAVLFLAALFLYFIAREFDPRRVIAVAVAAVYILLPNYSTDRFWFAAFTYSLTTMLFLLGVYAFARAIRSGRPEGWILLGLGALSAALLGTEVVFPLTAALPVALWLRVRQLHPDRSLRQLGVRRGVVVLSPMIVIVPAVLYKASFSDVSMIPNIFRMAFIGFGAFAVNFGTYGIALPHTVIWALRQVSWVALALGTVLAVLIYSYLSPMARRVAPRARPDWTKLALGGTTIFVLGSAIFLIAPAVMFWSAGVANRVWIAASIGVAVAWVAIAGWLSSWLSSGPGCNRAFAAVITSICLSGSIINSAVSGFWVSSWRRQLAVLDDVRVAVPKLESGTDFILDGVCPYIGPAIVFESNWDLAGALRIIYRDRTLRADVTTGDLSIGEDGLRTHLFLKSYFHPYGDNLLLFDYSKRIVHRLTDVGIARSYLSERVRCPAGAAGRGALMLPMDEWYGNGFRPWRRDKARP
jgi:hypothetical protein